MVEGLVNTFFNLAKHALLLSLTASLLVTIGCRDIKPVPKPAPDLTSYSSGMSYGGALVIRTDRNVQSIRPLEWESYSICDILYESLIKYDNSGIPKPQLAETWEVSDDFKTYLFKIKKGILWHDGAELEANDFSFTIHNSGPHQVSLDTVEILDRHSLRISLNQAYPSDIALTSSVVWFHTVPEHAFDFSVTDQQFLIGTGPFRLGHFEPGHEVLMLANADYHGGRPFLDSLIFRFIPDESIALNALKQGEIDYFEMNFDQFMNYRDDPIFKENFNIFKQPTTSLSLIFNMRKPILNNPEIRKALVLSCNRKRIISEFLHGHGKLMSGPFNPLSWANNPKISPHAYDRAQATNLLKQAGCSSFNSSGCRTWGDEELSFRLIFNGNSSIENHIARYLTEEWMELGATVKPEPLETADLIKAMENKDYDLCLNVMNLLISDPDWESAYFCSDNGDAENYNFSGYKNKRVDLLFEQGRKTLNREKRKNIYREIHELIHEDVPVITIAQMYRFYAISKRVHGVRVENEYLNSFRFWYIPENFQ